MSTGGGGECSVNSQFSGNQMLHVPLFAPTASWILPNTPWDYPLGHGFSLHTFALDWFFLSLWCQPPFLCWWYSCICLWFLTTLFFLCLADIKSLMFQNHIQLKLWETECLLSSSLNMQGWCNFSSVSGLRWPPISLQTGIVGVIFDW